MAFPLLAVPIISKTEAEASIDIEQAKIAGADILELRLDYMINPNLEKLVKNSSPLPVIMTNRAKEEGGYFDGTLRNNHLINAINIINAADSNKHYIDIELRFLPKWLRSKVKNLIVSYHNTSETPQNLEEIYQNIYSTGASIIKIAAMANNGDDIDRMIALVEKYNKHRPIIGICMGELGKITRLHPGNHLTFVCLPGKNSAPGQITIEDAMNYKKQYQNG